MSRPLTVRLHFLLSAAVLAAALLLGGGQGTLGDTLVQLLAVALLAVLLWRHARGELTWAPRWTWLPVLAVVALPLVQLLPLPVATWASLGGRGELAAQLQAAGVAPDPHWTLHPLGSERALYWLLPGLALALSAPRLPEVARRRLIGVVLVVAAVSVVLGLAQLAGGAESPLRLYANTNRGSAVGFFANRNHLASLLALSLPLAIAWTAAPHARELDGGLYRLRVVAGAGLCLLLLLGLAITLSRAGVVLGMLALAIVLPLLWRLRSGRGVRRISAGALLLAAVLVVQFALLGLLRRFETDPLADGRRVYAENTLRAASGYAPLGSGLGTFRQAYPPVEAADPRGPGSTIANHAHNDYVELWLEAGWIVAPAALALLGTLGWAAWQALRGAADDHERLARGAVVVALSVPLLHSLVDYPLRTSAHLAAFGLLFGTLLAHAAGAAHPSHASAAAQ